MAAIKIPKMEGLIFLCLPITARNVVSIRAGLHFFLFTFYEHSATPVSIHELSSAVGSSQRCLNIKLDRPEMSHFSGTNI